MPDALGLEPLVVELDLDHGVGRQVEVFFLDVFQRLVDFALHRKRKDSVQGHDNASTVCALPVDEVEGLGGCQVDFAVTIVCVEV